MTPERIAELRRKNFHDRAQCAEMLDEIERLRGLVRDAHEFGEDPHRSDRTDDPYMPHCMGCDWNWESIPCESIPCEFFDTEDEARFAHAAHVAELLNGGAK